MWRDEWEKSSPAPLSSLCLLLPVPRLWDFLSFLPNLSPLFSFSSDFLALLSSLSPTFMTVFQPSSDSRAEPRQRRHPGMESSQPFTLEGDGREQRLKVASLCPSSNHMGEMHESGVTYCPSSRELRTWDDTLLLPLTKWWITEMLLELRGLSAGHSRAGGRE